MVAPVVAAGVKKAGTWLAKRVGNISKHIGLHRKAAAKHVTRPWVMNKTVHTVFSTTNVRKLIEKTLRSFDNSAIQRNGRILIEKVFEGPIGRGGEKVLRVIIDSKTGRIVTAFPVEEMFSAAAATAFAVAFSDLVSDAIEESEKIVAANALLRVNRELNDKVVDLNRGTLEALVKFLVDFGLDPADSVSDEDERMLAAIAAVQRKHMAKLPGLLTNPGTRPAFAGPIDEEALKEHYAAAMVGAAGPLLDS